MNQSYIGITLDIIDYYPIDFDYSTFSFIFISEINDFEREISYINANQICQKIPIKKKDIKYSIKVTKDDSFIGITEFIIPYQNINKKDQIFDKTCSITMTDSIKKLLFGNISNYVPLKIGIHATLQYLGGGVEGNNTEKSDKKQKIFLKTKKKKEDKIKPFSPTKLISKDKSFNIIKNSSSGFNNKINSINILNNSVNKTHRNGESFISNKNNKTYRGHKRSNSSQRQKQNSPKLKSMKNMIKEKEKDKDKEIKTEINENHEKTNVIESYMGNISKMKKENSSNINNEEKINDILNKKEDNEEVIELKNNMDKYIEKNLNIKLNDKKEINEMIDYTNYNLKQLLNYQMKYYEFIKKEAELGNKYNELYLNYNEKYRTNLQRLNKLKEENKLNEIKKEVLLNNKNINDINNIINLKNKELNIFNEICSTIQTKKNENTNKEYNGKKEQFLLLLKILKKINNKYGPIQNLLNQSNSTEPERINLRKILNKYNKELEIENKEEMENTSDNNKKEEKIDKFEYVIFSKPDDIDVKLELFLKQFYLKHDVPKIIFKKTSKNNYEYGSQKIMIKLEGEILRVRYVGGYLLLDKFIELNAVSEDKKKNQKLNKGKKTKK